MSVIIAYGDDAQKHLQGGLKKLVDPVAITLGPQGQNVMLGEEWGPPVITNDGVSIAEKITLKNPFEKVVAEGVKDAVKKTDEAAGDGTTTATILTHAIAEQGFRNKAAGANPLALRQGINIAVEKICEKLKGIATEIDTKEQIASTASISAGDTKIGEIIAEAMDKVGKEGVITVESGKTLGLKLEITEGMQFDKGYISHYFVNDTERMESSFDNPYILITSSKISNIKELLPVLEKVMSSNKPLVIIADDVEGEALTTLIFNKARGAFKSVAIKAPGFGDRKRNLLDDIATITGATVISSETNTMLKDTTLDMLGTAGRIVCTKDSTTIIRGGGSKLQIKERADTIRAELKATDSSYDEGKLKERLAYLVGGVAVIMVGASTEVETKELTHRIEDASRNAKAAVEEGIVPGGGVALPQAARLAKDELDKMDIAHDVRLGISIVVEAVNAPMRQIAKNAGYEPGVVQDKISQLPVNYGLNALNGDYVNMIEARIIDPAKVSRCAIQNAASIASLLLTTDVIVVKEPEKDNAAKGGGMPGGMPGAGGLGDMDM